MEMLRDLSDEEWKALIMVFVFSSFLVSSDCSCSCFLFLVYRVLVFILVFSCPGWEWGERSWSGFVSKRGRDWWEMEVKWGYGWGVGTSFGSNGIVLYAFSTPRAAVACLELIHAGSR